SGFHRPQPDRPRRLAAAEGKPHFAGPALSYVPVDTLLLEDRLEILDGVAHAFRRAKKQNSAFVQRKMEHREDFLLSLGAQIDEKIAAADEVETRERRIGGQVMDG